MTQKEKIQQLQQKLDKYERMINHNAEMYLQNIQSLEETNYQLKDKVKQYESVLNDIKSQFEDAGNTLFVSVIQASINRLKS